MKDPRNFPHTYFPVDYECALCQFDTTVKLFAAYQGQVVKLRCDNCHKLGPELRVSINESNRVMLNVLEEPAQDCADAVLRTINAELGCKMLDTGKYQGRNGRNIQAESDERKDDIMVSIDGYDGFLEMTPDAAFNFGIMLCKLALQKPGCTQKADDWFKVALPLLRRGGRTE